MTRATFVIFFTKVIKFYWLMLLYPGELYRLLGASSLHTLFIVCVLVLVVNVVDILSTKSSDPHDLLFTLQSISCYSVTPVHCHFVSYVSLIMISFFHPINTRHLFTSCQKLLFSFLTVPHDKVHFMFPTKHVFL